MAHNAGNIRVERLYLPENEHADGGPVYGFLPFSNRFAAQHNKVHMLAYSETKGYELAMAYERGPVMVFDFNAQGSSYAGYPYYDERSIALFDNELFFYSLREDGDFEFSSFSRELELKSLDSDPSGSDIRKVPADWDPEYISPGLVECDGATVRYQASHIAPFNEHRGMLMSAASERIHFEDPETGLPLKGLFAYDLEPLRVKRGQPHVPEIVDMYPGGYSIPRNMVEFNGAVYMIAKVAGGLSACGEGRDYELVRLNDSGSSQVIEINPDGFGFFPNFDYPDLTVHGDALYFVANVGANEASRHELVRVDSGHSVSIVPINPDGAAFPSADEIQTFWAEPAVPAMLRSVGKNLYVFGARTNGDCHPDAGCAQPFQHEIVKIDRHGDVIVLDPTPDGSSTFSVDPEWAAFFPLTFAASEFDGELLFTCTGCDERPMYRLDRWDSIGKVDERNVVVQSINDRDTYLGVERAGKFYAILQGSRIDEYGWEIPEDHIVSIDRQGRIGTLEAPDMNYDFVRNLSVLDDRIVAMAEVFNSRDKNWETTSLGVELLIIHPNDSLGYVDLNPVKDEWGPLSSFPSGMTVVGNTLFFSGSTDPSGWAQYNDLFRLKLGRAGGQK